MYPIRDMDMDKYDALKLENQLCFPLYAASREVVKKYHPFLSELDLTYTQYIAMMVLWEEKKISAGDLGKKLFLDSGTLTPLLRSLDRKGYIRRYRSEEDERVLIAEITPSGLALRERAAEIPSKVAACFNLGREDAARLYSMLYAILGVQAG